ncbi:MAG: hypothetical protein ACRC92_21075, partial [Peptostreptococcaceae bacterium]
HLYRETTKPVFSVSIGVPTAEDSTSFGLEINDKNVVNNILLSLIRAESIDKISITDALPDANIKIDDTKMGVCYLWLKVWINGDEVVISLNEDGSNSSLYKKINGQLAKELINYISEYK